MRRKVFSVMYVTTCLARASWGFCAAGKAIRQAGFQATALCCAVSPRFPYETRSIRFFFPHAPHMWEGYQFGLCKVTIYGMFTLRCVTVCRWYCGQKRLLFKGSSCTRLRVAYRQHGTCPPCANPPGNGVLTGLYGLFAYDIHAYPTVVAISIHVFSTALLYIFNSVPRLPCGEVGGRKAPMCAGCAHGFTPAGSA